MKMIFNIDSAPSFARRELAGVAACAYASEALPDLGFHDEEARHLARVLDVERAGFTEQELRPLATRTRLVDDVVRDFFRRHPEGLAIGLFSGPCTRFSRVDNGLLHWIDIDVSGVVAWKRRRAPRTPRYALAAASPGCDHWIDMLSDAHGWPTLILGLGVFSQLGAERLSAFLTQASVRLARDVELLLDATPCLRLRPATARGARHAELHRDGGGVETFPWLRVLDEGDYPEPLGARVRTTNGLARFLRGSQLPILRHLRRM
ncbi:class I SAM-dependent methyltransferase [Sorangium sp. So ce1335]|uniref:class I SAM-dependent methyltransferase n=1 Tax=Sorangium sp. So ce1335 TaxID=3133335 RepID=UPI003F5D61E9